MICRRTLFIAMGLWLVFFVRASHAVEVCWDYPTWRVSVYESGSNTAADVNGTSRSVLLSWLSGSAKYERVQSWRVYDHSPPPIILRYGDVIIKNTRGEL